MNTSKNIIFLLLAYFISISIQGAEKKKIPVVFYLQNMPIERIGTHTDHDIIKNLENEGFLVITVDCKNFSKTSPEFEEELLNFHRSTPTLLNSYITSTSEPDYWSIYYVPEGYTLKKDIPIWNIKDHGADGSLEYIMDTWNKEMVELYSTVKPVTKPEEMTDQYGNPLDLNMCIDIIYPTGNASKQVPLVINLATGSPRQMMFNPQKDEEVTSRNIFPFSFLSTGYAWASADHCFNPLVRSDVWPKFFSRSSLDDYDGLALYTAYIRYIKLHLEQYNLNGKIGLMGISKAAYAATRLANKKNAEGEEYLLFNNKPNDKIQPWQGAESTVDVVYTAAGNGTRRIPLFVDKHSVPMITSAGYFDKYGQWDIYPKVVKHFQDSGFIHLPFWMEELGHTYPSMGIDLGTDIKRHVLFKKFFDHYLKGQTTDPLEIFYIYPKENATDIDQNGYVRVLAADELLPSSMQGLIPYEPITVRFLSKIDLQNLDSYLEISNKKTGDKIAGTWTPQVQQTVLTFASTEDFTIGETYIIKVKKGLRNIEGQELKEDVSREFTVSTHREEIGYTNKYSVYETQRLQDDITNGVYDTYELTTSGGNYTLTGTGSTIVSPSKSFTLKAADGLAEKPKLSISRPSTSTTTYMFNPSDTITAIFEGVEFDGENKATTENKGYPNFIRVTSGKENTQIIIKDCFFHNFSNTVGIFRIDATEVSFDIQNSTFKNNNTHIINFQTAALKYGNIYLKNNTFSNNSGTGSLICFAKTSSGNNILIDHITVDKFNTTANLFKLTTLEGTFQLKNSIFTDVKGDFNYPDLSNLSIDACYLTGFTTPPTGTNSFTGTPPSYANVDNLHYGLTNKELFICSDSLPAGNTTYYLRAPEALPATNITDSEFTANWLPVENAKGYEVSLFQGNSLIDQQVCESNISNYTFTDLISGTTYSYSVIAKYNGLGFDSEPSNLVNAITFPVGLEQEQEDKQNDIYINGKNILLPQTGSLEIYNLQGILLVRQNNITAYSSNLPSGLYVIKFISNESTRISKKTVLK